jgi:hypothetical protein
MGGFYPLVLKPRKSPLSSQGLQLQASLGRSLQCPLCLPELRSREQRPVREVFCNAWGTRCEPYTAPECWWERTEGPQGLTLRNDRQPSRQKQRSMNSVEEGLL